MNIRAKAKTALLSNFPGAALENSYTRLPQQNLLPGIDLATVENDLRRGDGDELRMKFCAIHSSAALAVNCFAPFKVQPRSLLLAGKQGAKKLDFERKLPIFHRGKAPNIDVWIQRDRDVVAVESKLLEYLTPKTPTFSDAYKRLAPPECESCWWQAYEEAKQGTAQFLDRAQLIKHYFGLNAFRKKKLPSQDLTLLYVFWEPVNWDDVDVCRQHREEVKTFAKTVADSQIQFRWMTYNDLWEEWSTDPNLATHAQNLKARYQVRLLR